MEFLCYLENQYIQQIRGADDCSLAHQTTNQLWNAERPFLVVQSSFNGKVHRVCLSTKFSSLYFAFPNIVFLSVIAGNPQIVEKLTYF